MSAAEFVKFTKKEFSFLTSEYGFNCVSETNHEIRFESDQVYLTIFMMQVVHMKFVFQLVD